MSTFKIKPAHATDSYKLGHRKMYPNGTAMVYSNNTPRHDKIIRELIPAQFYDRKFVHVGLQGLIKHMHFLWEEEFFSKPKSEVIDAYRNRVTPFVGPNGPDVEGMADLHDLGHLPIMIKGLPEGSVIGYGIPVFTIKNTGDGRFGWLTNYLETYLSNEYWKTATSATIARYYRIILEHYAKKTGSPAEFVDWQAHDFSCRGMSGMFDAAKTGFGHLTSFTGTDTLVACDYADYAYFGEETFIGGSVPASEHSVMTMGGPEGELELFRRLVTEVYPSGVVSLVSDSYDFWRVITEYARILKDDILNRTPDSLGLAKVVFRPDSGDPVEIVCGTVTHFFDTKEEAESFISQYHYDKASDACEGSHCCGEDKYETIVRIGNTYFKATTEFEYNRHDKTYYYVDGHSETTLEEVEATPEMKGAIECLWETFGGSITETGHKLLNPRVGLIYGDSITVKRMTEILDRLEKKGFASGNMVFGIGSYTYNYLTRDTTGQAVKATYGEVNGVGREIFKAPKTDSGLKHSARGLLKVDVNDGVYSLIQSATPVEEMEGELVMYYNSGDMTSTYRLAEIRVRIRTSL